VLKFVRGNRAISYVEHAAFTIVEFAASQAFLRNSGTLSDLTFFFKRVIYGI